MSSKNLAPPRLPDPSTADDTAYMAEFVRVLNIFFKQLLNPGPVTVSTQGAGTAKIIAGLSFSSPVHSGASIPTQADLANLRSGDVYCDTSASNVLKVKP